MAESQGNKLDSSQRTIQDELDDNLTKLEDAEKVIRNLKEKLSPVIRKENAETKGKDPSEDTSSASPLKIALATRNRILVHLVEELNQILHSLDLDSKPQ